MWLTLNEYQRLVSSTSNKAELGILLDACKDYMLNRKTAEKIISKVIKAVKGWRELAIRLGEPRERWICLPECWMGGVRYEAKIIMYDDGKYLIGGYETALYSKMLFEEIFG